MNIWIYSILMGYTIEFNFYVIRFYLQMKLYKKKKFKSDKLEIIYRWMILRKYLMLFSMLLKCFVKKGTFSFNVIKIVLCVKRTSIYIYSSPKTKHNNADIYLQRRIVVQCSHSFSFSLSISRFVHENNIMLPICNDNNFMTIYIHIYIVYRSWWSMLHCYS